MTAAENPPDPAGRPGETDPRFALMDLAMSYLFPAALRAAAVLGVADHLTGGPRPVAELAEAVGADPLNLYRTLRLLATRGIFTEDDAGRFALTPAAELLRADVASSFRPAVLMLTDRTFWRPAGELATTVRTGASAFEELFGMPFFDHFARDADTAAVFHVGMAAMSDPENPLIARACDLPPSPVVVDLGGGHGGLLLAVLRDHPDARGVLFDREHVLAGHRLGELGADHRWDLVAGDFFTEAPPGDVFLIKRILHDWDDEQCARILRHCRRAVSEGGRVLVVDAVVPPGNEPDPGKVIDLLMMSSLTGRERTRAEFEALFAAADLQLTRVIPTGTRLSIVEGVPAQ
ncbi:methyltransferase [Saccharothrix australiensis]|uniref:O-methyltransferase n=1 Tax=Saccharothrix australiensis TaxID=2072 RepID=A0A495W416_9PSEU|nr:methyltransferase [Saccharothrix australiensis]RKT55787.1 O-methyltransferase [Saccharothrix australiensis]